MTAPTTEMINTPVDPKRLTPFQRTWKRFFSAPIGWITMSIVALFALIGAFGPLVVPYPTGYGPNICSRLRPSTGLEPMAWGSTCSRRSCGVQG